MRLTELSPFWAGASPSLTSNNPPPLKLSIRHLFLPLSFLGVNLAQNQDSLVSIQFLKQEVRQLCQFDGRGYARDGYQRAARYLIQRFQKMGYDLGVDTFRHVVRFVEQAFLRPLRGRPWRVGIDFWPHPASPSMEGTFEVDTLPKPGKLWLLPETLPLQNALRQALHSQVRAVLRPVKKVTATYADEPLPLVLIETTQKPAAGTYLKVSIKTRRLEVENYNVIASKRGKQDSIWILGAHYDHLGRVGRTVFWGANDNASGIAFLLLLAHRLRRDTLPHSVVFVAFGGEEAGLLGAYSFVGQHDVLLTRLRGMLNFDLMGYGEKGIAVVGASDQVALWEHIARYRPPELWERPYLLRPNAPNSDHYPFRERGYPALFFYLQGGPGYYHDPMDRPETLSWHSAYDMVRWIEALLRAED